MKSKVHVPSESGTVADSPHRVVIEDVSAEIDGGRPRSREEISSLLNVHLLETSVYELGYELNTRPDRVKLPLRGILKLLETVE